MLMLMFIEPFYFLSSTVILGKFHFSYEECKSKPQASVVNCFRFKRRQEKPSSRTSMLSPSRREKSNVLKWETGQARHHLHQRRRRHHPLGKPLGTWVDLRGQEVKAGWEVKASNLSPRPKNRPWWWRLWNWCMALRRTLGNDFLWWIQRHLDGNAGPFTWKFRLFNNNWLF